MAKTKTMNEVKVEAHRVANFFRQHQAENRNLDLNKTLREIEHGEKVEEEIRSIIVKIWYDGPVTFRLISVRTLESEINYGKGEDEIKLETYVIRC